MLNGGRKKEGCYLHKTDYKLINSLMILLSELSDFGQVAAVLHTAPLAAAVFAGVEK